ncbi:MAG TPA: PEP-CTERM sorting domain-containing protein [Phycisphaerae bacterium]|nr:PEP-CTERM sorting domain-containing protein [Phycisphaerae bacterium]
MHLQRRTLSVIVLFGALSLAAAERADAAFLNVLGVQFPAPAEPDPVGGTVIDTMTVPVVAPTFTGTLTSSVISGDLSTPFAGGLTFTYLLTNDATSLHPQGRLTVNGYDGFLTDTSYQIPTTDTVPSMITRNISDVIGFNFFTGISPGTQSALLVIQTDAPDYLVDIASVINGTVTTVPSFAPVPEPATLGMLALSGLALLGIRRR